MTPFVAVISLLVAFGVGFTVGHLFGEEAERERLRLKEHEAKATAWTKTVRERDDASGRN